MDTFKTKCVGGKHFFKKTLKEIVSFITFLGIKLSFLIDELILL